MFLSSRLKGRRRERARALARAHTHARTPTHTHTHGTRTRARARAQESSAVNPRDDSARRVTHGSPSRARPESVADRYHSSRQRSKPPRNLRTGLPPSTTTTNMAYGRPPPARSLLRLPTGRQMAPRAHAVPFLPPSRCWAVGHPRPSPFPASRREFTSASTGACVSGTFQNGLRSKLCLAYFLSRFLQKTK